MRAGQVDGKKEGRGMGRRRAGQGDGKKEGGAGR